MQLTATNLSELVRALRSNAGPGEKRKHPRVGLRVKAEIIVNEQSHTVWVRDLSAGGTNLSSSREIPDGTFFDLVLSDSDKIGCVVCHCRHSGPSTYAIGARFSQDVMRRVPSR